MILLKARRGGKLISFEEIQKNLGESFKVFNEVTEDGHQKSKELVECYLYGRRCKREPEKTAKFGRSKAL